MKNEENEALLMTNSEDIDSNKKSSLNNSLIIEKIQKMYKSYYKSKWSNLKLFIQDKTSLKASIGLLKRKTIEQFSSKCIQIYLKKIEIQLITKKNREMFTSLQFNYHQDSKNNLFEGTELTNDEIISKLRIKDLQDNTQLSPLRDFFFKFRENNTLMMRLIECLDTNQFEIIVPFLCHFFYENFYIENNEQEEILYIIYLLLEKEIDSLYTPSVSTFLDKSFVSMFLTEIGNRYEIKHYIDIILNYLIRNIEEINISYYCLDIKGNICGKNIIIDKKEKISVNEGKNKSYKKKLTKKNDDNNSKIRSTFFKSKFYNVDNSTFFGAMSTGNILKKKKLFEDNNFKTYQKINNSKLNMKDYLKKELYDILFFDIDEKYIRIKFENEKNEILRHFYARLLRQIKSASNPDLYNTGKYFENLVTIYPNMERKALEDFNKGYYLVTKFISELLDNLENIKIIPYSIKVICKFINTLLTKKFKNISKIQCFLLVNRFLFDKLLIPVIQNPDINDTGKNMIITLNTRKNLYYVYQVLKKLTRGELFEEPIYRYMTVFNKYIIDNFERLNNIVERLLKVKAPKKLMKLSEDLYEDEKFNLDDVKRNEQCVNYDYFKENPHDFMHHKSICFSKKELELFFNIVENNKERFIQGENLGKIFKNLKSLMPSIIFKPYEYFVIISDNYNNEVNELLFFKEPKIILGKQKTKIDLFNNLKHCISYLISKLEIFPNWVWATENLDTIKTFEYIDSYLNLYYNNRNKIEKHTVPLNWYSSYIVKNLKNLEEKYKINDFQLFYDSLESEIFSQIKKARNLNHFLTINMTTKNFVIDKKIKIYELELENVKSTELNIKTAQFIESAKIKVCLTNSIELNDFLENWNIPLESESESENQPYKLIISKESECIHRQKLDKKILRRAINTLILNKTHCSCINEFTQHLSDYYSLIGEDILNSYNRQGENMVMDEKINSKKTMVKEIIEIYKNYIIEKMNESSLLTLQKNTMNKNGDIAIRVVEGSFDLQTLEEKKMKLIKKYEDEKINL